MTTHSKRPRPIVLTVLDGWGYRPEIAGNAIALARKPNYDRLLKEFPNTLIQTSGPSVGLPEGQMGNSEVGHLNIGAGRVVQMDITRIEMLLSSGDFAKQPLRRRWNARATSAAPNGPGERWRACTRTSIIYLRCCEWRGKRRWSACSCTALWMGATRRRTAGSITSRSSSRNCASTGGEIATVSGRYYAMDRDNRWERIERAYRALVHGAAEASFPDAASAVRANYAKDVTDEFIVPAVIMNTRGHRAARRDSRRRRGDFLQLPRGPAPARSRAR